MRIAPWCHAMPASARLLWVNRASGRRRCAELPLACPAFGAAQGCVAAAPAGKRLPAVRADGLRPGLDRWRGTGPATGPNAQLYTGCRWGQRQLRGVGTRRRRRRGVSLTCLDGREDVWRLRPGCAADGKPRCALAKSRPWGAIYGEGLHTRQGFACYDSSNGHLALLQPRTKTRRLDPRQH